MHELPVEDHGSARVVAPETPHDIVGNPADEDDHPELAGFFTKADVQDAAGRSSVAAPGTGSLLRGAAECTAVRIIEDYQESPVIVSMDDDEIKPVFIDLMNNALQAMPLGGELRVRADAGRANDMGIEFSDIDHGIPEEHLGKIFERFFSTKGHGNGTGQGLSFSYRIIQCHGGRIKVESDVSRGSLIRVILPLQTKSMVKEFEP